jgi:hypothetical protein
MLFTARAGRKGKQRRHNGVKPNSSSRRLRKRTTLRSKMAAQAR